MATENNFINSIRNVTKGIGDDCAYVDAGKKYWLYTTDSIVENVHFTLKKYSPENIGRKAIAVNVSDIAAMGGKPKQCLVSLFLPTHVYGKLITKIYQGIVKECRKYRVDIIGGNIAKSEKLIIDIFMIGEVKKNKLILRSGAKVGDKVLVTGTLGKKNAWERVPTPRVHEGQMIARSKKATAMIDISDGLSTDLLHICEESQVGVKLFTEKIPTNNLDLALNGGEDYELCFTAPVSQIKGVKTTVIGEIIPRASGCWLIDKKGNKSLLQPKGWDHFP